MSLLWRQESMWIDEIPVCTGMTLEKKILFFALLLMNSPDTRSGSLVSIHYLASAKHQFTSSPIERG
ncbi:MAG: hypothetical protein N2319_06495 [Candidatus Kapabacteria bacterium]|nr:hypothetical protein [Candidatus Kapabacteria bacterium]